MTNSANSAVSPVAVNDSAGPSRAEFGRGLATTPDIDEETAASGARPAAARTPADLQDRRTLARRRALMLALSLGTLAGVAFAVAKALSVGGWSWAEIVIYGCILISAPWMVLGFWNAVIGLWLLRASKDPLAQVSPFWRDVDRADPVTERVAVLMTLRNEDPARAMQRLIAVRESLDAAAGEDGAQFDIFVLSDSDQPEIMAQEDALFAANHAALAGRGAAVYRRRELNTGFKAGNVREFLERWGDAYPFMLPLDADSLMSGDTILRLTRIMQRHPRLGILQSLAVGTPSESPFARLFQFGMRHGMRSFTMGSAWWQGDCGPFWGHNALVRVAPFKAHCDLPVLPGRPPLGGHILSHDQVEAALMRRAGYEVRVAPVEGGSWEDNPVTLLDFMKREQRWCNGNMQYWRLLGMRGLPATSRFQLFQAIMMYLGSPAWMLMTALAGVMALSGAFDEPGMHVDVGLAVTFFFLMFVMSLSPKLAGAIDVLLEPGGVARYGGRWRFAKSVLGEILFGVLMAPAVALRLTLFQIGLLFGRKIGWSGQVRDAYGLEWATAVKGLWPQTLFGLGIVALLLAATPGALLWAAPVLSGLVFAIPFAVVTAHPGFGAWMKRRGVAQIPEEVVTDPTLAAMERVRPRLGAAAARDRDAGADPASVEPASVEPASPDPLWTGRATPLGEPKLALGE